MITLILPGYSSKNKSWAEETADSLKLEGQIRPVFWDHWEDENQKFDAEEKATLAVRHSKGDKINIIAKSIGTLVAAFMAKEIPNQLNKIILCGIPISDNWLKKGNIELISQIPSDNLIVFQNTSDPLGSYSQVKELFPNFKVIKKEASDHNYPYYEDFQKFLED